jgi:hypothetical protein
MGPREEEEHMSITDFLAIYGALLATVIAVWDVAKYVVARPRLRVSCYVAEMVTPGVGVTGRDLIAYSIANPGGKPMVVRALGGALRSGSYFLFDPQAVQLPLTLKPRESVVVPVPMPRDISDVTYFIVHDGLDKQWRATTDVVRKQLAARAKK